MPRDRFDDDDFEQFDDAASTSNILSSESALESKNEPLEIVRTSKKYLKNNTPRQLWTNLSEDELRMKTRSRAIYFLSRREYGRVELRQKLIYSLRNTPISADMIDEALDFLEKNNWQSDARFAAQKTKIKSERYGMARVKYELSRTGVSAALIDEQVAQLAHTEQSRAREVRRRTLGTPPADAKDKDKQNRVTASRGPSFEVIKKVIAGVDDEFDNEFFS